MSLYLDREDVARTSAGSKVKFNQIRVNLGDGYDIETGTFSAPMHGIYFFTLSYMTSYDNYSNLGLFVNDERLCVTFANKPVNVATCSAMTELRVGDVISVRGFQAGGNLYPSNSVYKNHHSLVGFLYKSL